MSRWEIKKFFLRKKARGKAPGHPANFSKKPVFLMVYPSPKLAK